MARNRGGPEAVLPSFTSAFGSMSHPGSRLPVGFPSSSTLGPVAQFSVDLHDMEAAHTLQSLGQDTQSQVPETQLSTQQIVAELSFADSEIQFRGDSGASVAFPIEWIN